METLSKRYNGLIARKNKFTERKRNQKKEFERGNEKKVSNQIIQTLQKENESREEKKCFVAIDWIELRWNF